MSHRGAEHRRVRRSIAVLVYVLAGALTALFVALTAVTGYRMLAAVWSWALA
jgi:hypothetical protein